MTPHDWPLATRPGLYYGDNGRITCERLACAGMTAHYSGRDLSGQPMLAISLAMAARFRRDAWSDPKCETCGSTALVRPTGLFVEVMP